MVVKPLHRECLLGSSESGLRHPDSQLLDRWDTASPALQGELLKRIGPRLNPAFQLRYGTATPTPCRPRSGHGKIRAASIPGLFWRGWTLRLNPGGLFDPLPYRQALSVLLQIARLGDLDYAAARSLLGLPSASNAVCPHFTKKLRQASAWEPVLAVLSQLARTLDDHPAPIDYGRRRRWRRLSAATLDDKAWRAACKQIRYRTSERQERFARLHLIELLTGSHPYYFPEPLTLSPSLDGEDYTTFVFTLPAQLSAHLHQQAQILLQRLHIDEPATWEPPIDWADTITWPGPHPDDVRPEQLWELARQGLTRSAIATRLHTTPEHIHLAAIRHPQPWTRRHSPGPGTQSPPIALPCEHKLRTYVGQGLRPGQIARLTGCSHQRISQFLTSSGIGPPLSREVLRTLDPAWLREQYEDNHRSFADIATDLGIRPLSARTQARTRHPPRCHRPQAHPRRPRWPRRILHHHLDRLRHPRSRTTHPTTPGNPRTPQPQPRRQTPRGQKSSPHPSSRLPRTGRRRHPPGNRAQLSAHQADS